MEYFGRVSKRNQNLSGARYLAFGGSPERDMAMSGLILDSLSRSRLVLFIFSKIENTVREKLFNYVRSVMTAPRFSANDLKGVDETTCENHLKNA